MKDRPNGKERRAASRAEEPDSSPDEEPQEEEETRLSDLSDKALKKKMRDYTEEYQLLAPDQSNAAMNRRVQLTRLLRGTQDVIDAREPIVEVQVPASVTGEPFQIGPATFNPGLHRVRASVAQYLLWLIGENQRIELNRLKSNGRTIDLGSIGSRARMAAITRDSGDDDYTGRGR